MRREQNVILTAKYHPDPINPTTVKLLFVQYSNLVRKMGNVNAIRDSQNEQNKDIQPWRGFFR